MTRVRERYWQHLLHLGIETGERFLDLVPLCLAPPQAHHTTPKTQDLQGRRDPAHMAREGGSTSRPHVTIWKRDPGILLSSPQSPSSALAVSFGEGKGAEDQHLIEMSRRACLDEV